MDETVVTWKQINAWRWYPRLATLRFTVDGHRRFHVTRLMQMAAAIESITRKHTRLGHVVEIDPFITFNLGEGRRYVTRLPERR